MAIFQLRFPLDDIQRWAAEYSDFERDVRPIEIGDAARRAGFLARSEFLILARWKSPRPGKRHEHNDDDMVREVTRFAFSTPNERLRLGALTLLSGVLERTASAILHLCHRDPYPLMDVRAFWSLGIDKVPANWAAVWWEYTQECRAIAARAKVDMRTLDRALWAYSDAHGMIAC
ncbi:MAG: hypothetical protein JNM07_14700 [Phycisphaerae bacterium]|nr:hypothetical protein [Phycisphaerae bacterium]